MVVSVSVSAVGIACVTYKPVMIGGNYLEYIFIYIHILIGVTFMTFSIYDCDRP